MLWLMPLPLLALFVQVHSARGYVVMPVSAERIEDPYALRILRRLTGPSILSSQQCKSEQLANR